MRNILLVLSFLIYGTASADPSTTINPLGPTKGDQKIFRDKYWSALKAQGWVFLTEGFGPPPSQGFPIDDWFFQSVRSRGATIRSAWVLMDYYAVVGSDPENTDIPNFQSEKSLYWVDCSEESLQIRVSHRYRNAFGTDLTATSIAFPAPIDLPTSAPAQFTEVEPNSIGHTLVKAICSATL